MAVAFSPAVAEFLRQPITAAIVTLNTDGSPQVTYVWHEFTGEQFLVSTAEGRTKDRNIRRDNRVAISILDPRDPYRWVSVNGTVAITKPDPGAKELIHRLAIKYQGPEEGDIYGRKMMTPDRIILTITPEKVLTMGF